MSFRAKWLIIYNYALPLRTWEKRGFAPDWFKGKL